MAVDNRDEKELAQYIFGQPGAAPAEPVRAETRAEHGSKFSKWKMLFWEQCLADGTCRLTEYAARMFGLPEKCENFPMCLFGKGVLSQQTEAAFRRADFRLRAGEEHFSYEAVVNSSADLPKWLEIECSLECDDEGLPAYAVCVAHDISPRKLLEQKYQDQIAYRNGLCANTLNCMRIDLTEDRITEYNTPVGEITEMCAMFPTADACLRKITEDMIRRSDVEKYRDVLTTQGLLDAYHGGQNNVVVEYYDTMLQKWLKINFVILKNPSNAHIDCFGICTDISESKLLEITLNNVTKQDYALVGVVDTLAREYLYLTGSSAAPVVRSYDSIGDIAQFLLDECCDICGTAETAMLRQQVDKALAERREYSVTVDGHENDRRFQVYLSPLENDEHLFMMAIRDITDVALLQRLSFDARHDALTGLYNRDKAFAECNRLLAQHPDETFLIVHFDIQKFRLYNSFFGETEGDRLLKYIADMFRELSHTHPCGVFGRIEADVFFLCFPWRENVVEENQAFIRRHLLAYRADFQVTGNCGIYVAADRTLAADAMFNRAAVVAKDNPTKQLNPVAFFNEQSEVKLDREHEIALEMQRALDEKQFVVYLQPKYKLFTGEPFGAEALVRWMHPAKGMIPPGDFIPLFESNGFIIQLDRYMWEQVCILLRQWLDAGIQPAPVSVNMSRVSMYSPQTVPFLKNLVEKYKLPPALLNLELTESAYMDAPGEMKSRLEELRAYGFHIMMDDFGSGYSSLNTLREIPVDYLKVDRVFLASVDQDKRSRQVLSAVVHMASMMGIPVITEGVETEAQREFLCSIGCDYVQGFLYAKPMPVSDYEQRILTQCERYAAPKGSREVQLSKISMNMDTEVQRFSNLLPYALAFVEYVNGSFSYLSANDLFLQTFGMRRDITDPGELLEKHLSAEGYEALLGTYKKCAETAIPQECLIQWRHSGAPAAFYFVRVQYIGASPYSAVLTATFVDATALCAQLGEDADTAATDLLTRSIYTMKELLDYVHLLNQSFDIARMVRPEQTEAVTAGPTCDTLCASGECYSFWGKTARCQNCSTLRALHERTNQYKIEKKDDTFYLVCSHPARIRDVEGGVITDVVIETLMKLTDGLLRVLLEGDRSRVHAEFEKYQQLSYHDSLTPCFNRRYFNEARYLSDPDTGCRKGDSLAFIMIDLDSFKGLNDTYGHDVGDQVLILVAEALVSHVRQADAVVRYGGDEFLVITGGCTPTQLQAFTERLRSAIAELRFGRGSGHNIQASFGCSYRPQFDATLAQVHELLKEADSEMYADKNRRRGE